MVRKWMVPLKEMQKVSSIAAPMVAVSVLQYLLQVVSVMMVGHLDELSLSGASTATSFSVSGFSFLFGMASALETLCGQAYGAEQFHKLGIYTYCSIIPLILLCFPISLLWIFTDKLLILIGQDPVISRIAQKYAVCLIPNLFSYAVLQSLIRFLQAQSLILPMFFSSVLTLCFHIPLCWVLVFGVKLGSIGAALSVSLSYWLNVFLVGFYNKFSSGCEKTRVAFSKDVIASIPEFFRFAVPSAVMVCLEWWSYEVLILLSGLLPNPKLETSLLSICFTITYLHYFIPYGFGATASIRVSNELGAGNPQAAKMAVAAVMILVAAEMVTIRVLSFASPLLWIAYKQYSQKMGAYVNLGAYYLVGIPVAAVLAFVLHLKGKGLLIGLATGSAIQATLLGLRTIFTNWQKQVSKARHRIFEGDSQSGL
ncbi:Protein DETOXIFICATION [Melia azedarach]|uniref:Protein DETOXIFICATION n=1 Tax=Melia azedarach TaxID=155640 RepID=A0ACC1XRD6_MELAZ|nr:Protein DETOXIFICATION [Melia azedarach]